MVPNIAMNNLQINYKSVIWLQIVKLSISNDSI